MSSPSIFPWDNLPDDVQKFILSRLPISKLLALKSLSASFLSSIRSLPASIPFPRDPFFFVFPSTAYQPSRDRWVSLSLPSYPSGASGSRLLLAPRPSNPYFSVINPFSNDTNSLPPTLPMFYFPYAIALDVDCNYDFKVVVVTTSNRISSQIYDSRRGSWILGGELPGRFHFLDAAVFLDGLMYVLSHGPDRLLTFDLGAGEWGIVETAMPSLVHTHLMVFDGKLLLVGGVKDVGVIERIGIWEFDRKEKREWGLLCLMPDEVFVEFSGVGSMEYYRVCDGSGMLCFYNVSKGCLLMCDLVGWRWWWPSNSLLQTKERREWWGYAVEPSADLLK